MADASDAGRVLVVEDHEPTARIIATAFDELDVGISTHIVGDGGSCLSALQDPSEELPAPDLVLLDLDLPEIGGLDVLDTRFGESSLRTIPTIVFSGTADPRAVQRCYKRGANAFVSKPEDFDGYLAVADAIATFWFSTAELPNGASGIDR